MEDGQNIDGKEQAKGPDIDRVGGECAAVHRIFRAYAMGYFDRGARQQTTDCSDFRPQWQRRKIGCTMSGEKRRYIR